MLSNLAGVLPAVVTPFTQAEQFNPSAFELLLERLYAAGIHGLYVCGQTGEGLLQPLDMRRQVAAVAVRCSPPGKSVVVHVGGGRTEDAVALARHASRIGAHAVSSLPPAGGYAFSEVRRYYEAIATASDLPVLVYYFPETANSIQSLDQILELCAIPNVVGLKFTDFDLFKLSLIRRAGHVVFNGRDEVFAAGLLVGASGGIGSFYNLVPELFVSVYELSLEARWTEAQGVQDRINDLIAIALRFPCLAAIKTMLRWSDVDCGACLGPRRPLTKSEETALQAQLRARFGSERFLQGARVSS